MRFATFLTGDKERIGIISEDIERIYPIDEALNIKGIDMLGLIKAYSSEMKDELRNRIKTMDGIPMKEVKLISPIPNPLRSVICLGKNYLDHVNEVKSLVDLKGNIPEHPIYFEKIVDRCPGDNEKIPSHKDETELLDYEVELAVIIGKEGRDIPSDKVEEYIFGYTILNDITARDLQKKNIQWFRGKSLDGTCPLGPWIIEKEDVEYPPKFGIKSYVNEELRQNGNTGELIFDINYIISDFSKGITLKPGDIISTGTPAGVGMGFNPPKTLKPGDVVKCVIEKIGSLTNIVE